MLKAEIQTVVLRPVHHGEIQAVRIVTVAVPLCLIADIAKVNQSLLAQCRGLVRERDRLIAHAERCIVDFFL